jgi:serine/threonine-protein kinase
VWASSIDVRALAGATLADKYRLLELVGDGGTGVVYRAEQLELGRSVAVKLLDPAVAAAHLGLFRTEALAASRINHPHAVAIYDFGVLPDADVPYLVMEYLRGRTLAQTLAAGPLPPARAVTIAAQLLSALAEAHACGVIHRDIKADNAILELLRDGDDFAKLIDFGIARLAEGDDRIRGVAGTPEYMAPEQIRGQPVTAATDIYATGILLYEMVTGATPFSESRDLAELLRRHVEVAPPPLPPSCPEPLAAVIAQALAKAPRDRYPSARAMRDALLHAASTPEAERSCPACGELVAARQRFCGACGKPLDVAAPAALAREPADELETIRLRTPPLRASRLDLAPAPTTAVEATRDRPRERAALSEFITREAEARVLVVLGPRGAGKAHLVAEAIRAAGEATTAFATGPDPTGLAVPWFPIRAMLEAVLELPAGVDAGGRANETERAAALDAAIERLALSPRDRPGLRALVELESSLDRLPAASQRRETECAARRALASAHRRWHHPTLCFFDADRLDAPSLRVLAALCRQLPAGGPRVVLSASRRGALPHRARVLDVAGLTVRETAAFAERRCAGAAPPADELHAITGGLPEALTHILPWLAHGHALSRAPRALVDLIAERLRPLLPRTRRVLQAVAIHGSSARAAEVDATLGDDAKAALAELEAEGLLSAEGDALALRSDLVRDVVRASTPVDVARVLHGRALANLPASSSPLLRAHHAFGARNTRALAYCMNAGTWCTARFDDAGAARWYARAAELGEDQQLDRQDRADVTLALADVLGRMGHASLATEVLTQAALGQPSAHQRAEIIRQQARLAVTRADEDAETLLQRALEQAKRLDARGAPLIDGARALAARIASAGRLQQALDVAVEALDAATAGAGFDWPTPDSALPGLAADLIRLMLETGDTGAARALGERALGYARRHALSAGLAELERAAARIELHDDAPERARRLLRDALERWARLGDRRASAEVAIELAQLAPDKDTAQRAEMLSRAREIADELADRELGVTLAAIGA